MIDQYLPVRSDASFASSRPFHGSFTLSFNFSCFRELFFFLIFLTVLFEPLLETRSTQLFDFVGLLSLLKSIEPPVYKEKDSNNAVMTDANLNLFTGLLTAA